MKLLFKLKPINKCMFVRYAETSAGGNGKMKALRFNSQQKKLYIEDVPIPKAELPKDVVIKVAYAGVCGTDLHIIAGAFACRKEPVTMGHEFCGTVTEVGCDVKGLKKGDRVAIDPNSSCDSCIYCHSGRPHFCPFGTANGAGIWRDGGFAEYCLIREREVHKIPDAIHFQQAAITEPLSCIAHGWDIISPIFVGQKILVLGAGFAGILWICLLHLQGHRNVTIAELNPTRLNQVKKLDVDYELITPDELQKNACDPEYLFDVIIDNTGNPEANELAVKLMQRGGKLCIYGVAPQDAEIKIKPFDVFNKELSIYGAVINPFTFPKAIGFIESLGCRYLQYDKLGVEVFTLDEYREGFESLKKGNITKTMFKL